MNIQLLMWCVVWAKNSFHSSFLICVNKCVRKHNNPFSGIIKHQTRRETEREREIEEALNENFKWKINDKHFIWPNHNSSRGSIVTRKRNHFSLNLNKNFEKIELKMCYWIQDRKLNWYRKNWVRCNQNWCCFNS